MTKITSPHQLRAIALLALLAIGFGWIAGQSLLLVDEPLLLVAALVGLNAMFILANQPRWGLYSLLFITYIRLSDVLVNIYGMPSLVKIFIPVMGAVILWRWVAYREVPTGWQRPLMWMAGYVLVGCSALLYAQDQLLASEGVETLVKDVSVGIILVILLQRASQLRYAVWSLIAAGLFLGTVNAYQQIAGDFTNNYWGFAQTTVEHIVGDLNHFRAAGPLTPNFFALILVAVVPLAVDRFWHEQHLLLRLIAGWAVAASILSIIFSFSRGGFLALAVVLGLMLLLYRPRPRTMLITGFLLLIMVLLAPANYQERMLTMVDSLPLFGQSETLEEVSFRGRLSEVTVALQMFADHPVAGVGYDNFDIHYLTYSQYLGLDTRREERQAHSLYLEIAAETGLVGILTFLILLTGLYFSIQQARHIFRLAGEHDYVYLVDALAVGMIGYLTGSLFLHAAFPRYFWLWVAIILALPRVATTELAMMTNLATNPTTHPGVNSGPSTETTGVKHRVTLPLKQGHFQ